MITIYRADNGKLFTDPKGRFYIDSDLLKEKAVAVRTEAVLNRIARVLGYPSFDSLRTFTRCMGVTEDTLDAWILSGVIAEKLNRLVKE